jgi:hypothetical protein
VELSEKLSLFCEKKFSGNRSKLARAIKVPAQYVHRWCEGTEMPAAALLKIVAKYPDAKDFFLQPAPEDFPIAAEEETPWPEGDKRTELVALVKDLIQNVGEEDYDMIDALISNVKSFRKRIAKEKKR